MKRLLDTFSHAKNRVKYALLPGRKKYGCSYSATSPTFRKWSEEIIDTLNNSPLNKENFEWDYAPEKEFEDEVRISSKLFKDLGKSNAFVVVRRLKENILWGDFFCRDGSYYSEGGDPSEIAINVSIPFKKKDIFAREVRDNQLAFEDIAEFVKMCQQANAEALVEETEPRQ